MTDYFEILISAAIVFAVCSLANDSKAQEIDLSLSLLQPIPHNWIGTTGSEYGEGPIVVMEASTPITRNIEAVISHKSYLLTGAPFNDNYESTYTAIGVRMNWEVEL